MKKFWQRPGVWILGCVCVAGLAVLAWPRTGPAEPASSQTAESSVSSSASQGAASQPEAPADWMAGAFGFTNGAGDAFLVPRMGPELEAPEQLTRVVGENGVVLQLTYAGWQEGTAQDTGRFTADNFDNIPGWRYTVTEGTPGSGKTYYAAPENALEPALLETRPGDGQPLDETAAELEAEKGRAIQNSWLLAELGEENGFYLVLFAPGGGEELLASVVVSGPEGLLSKDYPAQLNGGSAWRVDDGGTMDPSLFQLVFAAEDAQGLALGVSWLGAEGESTVILRQNGSALEETGPSLYRYTAIG